MSGAAFGELLHFSKPIPVATPYHSQYLQIKLKSLRFSLVQKLSCDAIRTLKELELMKTYSTVVSGREMSKFIHIPDEFRDSELRVVVRPVRKKKERFAGLFLNPVRVTQISIPSRDEINER